VGVTVALFERKNISQPLVNTSVPNVVVRTSNVAKELMSTAANHKVSVKTLDFRLLDTQTFIRTLSDGDEWIEVGGQEIADIEESMYLNPKFEIKQIYEIEIFTSTAFDPLETLELSIAGNTTLTTIYLTIKEGSHASYSASFEADFFELIKKKKLRANLMIGIFDSMMRSNLLDLIAKIRVYGEYTFEESQRCVVALGYEPIVTVDDKLILHYDKKHQAMDEEGRVNYAKRGYIVSVVENDLLIEYIKPLKGTMGRNVRGEILLPKEPAIRNEPTFTFTDNIVRNELEKTIEFRAKTGGYVTLEGGVYDIKSEMDVSEISFRSTGSIDTDLGADVSINVKEKDALKDAIGMGMVVTVHTINVEGSVGQDAKITAQKATIEGQVHSSATVSADELSVNVLKGKAFGREIHVSRLEQGEIEGEKVFVGQAVGGKIRAREVVIELLGSHVKITASKSIEIKKLVGGENVLTIDPLLNETQKELGDDEEKIQEAQKELQETQKELSFYEDTIKDNLVAYEGIKKKLLHYKQNGIKPPMAFVEKYQQFQHFKKKLDELREQFRIKSDISAQLGVKRTSLQDDIFDARIINHDRWRNYNEVIFKLIDPPMDITYFPVDGSDENMLGLHEDEDGEFTIRVVSK
jgi:uncharacterized protein (DUF342 family)